MIKPYMQPEKWSHAS